MIQSKIQIARQRIASGHYDKNRRPTDVAADALLAQALPVCRIKAAAAAASFAGQSHRLDNPLITRN